MFRKHSYSITIESSEGMILSAIIKAKNTDKARTKFWKMLNDNTIIIYPNIVYVDIEQIV